MKILVFGSKGQVASELKPILTSKFQVRFAGSNEANFLNPDQVVSVIRDAKPEVIINAAAYTAVDHAETDREVARKINATTVGIISDEAKRLNSLLIHYSTDYVFDGQKTGAYKESDSTRPINHYGHTKLEGEKLIQEVDGSAIILRVTWIYGAFGQNFFKTMRKLGREKASLKIVSDQVGSPTWSHSIAQVTQQILLDKNLQDKRGLYHFQDEGETSWYNFARRIFDIERELKPGSYEGLKEVLPIRTSDYPTPAKRPLNSRLDCSLFLRTFGNKRNSWDKSLRNLLEQLCAEE